MAVDIVEAAVEPLAPYKLEALVKEITGDLDCLLWNEWENFRRSEDKEAEGIFELWEALTDNSAGNDHELIEERIKDVA